MIKKAGHIIVILSLLLGTTGVTITRHYCGTDLVNTSLYSAPQHCCNANCPRCHDEIINVRITDNFSSSQSQVNLTAQFTSLLERHSLPTLLAFSGEYGFAMSNNQMGDRSVKPYLQNPFSAGHSTPFLQVFSFLKTVITK